jgi:nitrite reductase/ring-hydroxylating ferredoxin subunit
MTTIEEAVGPVEAVFEDLDVPSGADVTSITPVVIPVEAYVSEDYAKAENDLLWGKVWQIACRVEEIPNTGDYVTYDIVDESIIIVRSAPDRIEAFYNVCQHRGRRLTEGCGNTHQFRCNFHGWRWKLDGQNVFVNDRRAWGDELTPENTKLPSVNCDTWGGWVWINMDPDCEPLLDFLEPAPSLLGPFELDRMRYRWRQRLIFPCNWKTALEAFNESHHAAITHPQLNKFGVSPFWSCHAEGKHGWHGPAVSSHPGRPGANNARAAAGPARSDTRLLIWQTLKNIMEEVNSCTTDTIINAAARLVHELPEGTPPAEVLAHLTASAERDDANRGVIWPKIDPEIVEKSGHDWHLFPNSVVLHGVTYALCYRARPNGTNPNSCVFETYVIERYPEGGEPRTDWEFIPDPTDPRWPNVLQQDFSNMPEVQKGMKSRGFKGARPNPRAEVVVAHFHKTLSDYMGRGAPVPLA